MQGEFFMQLLLVLLLLASGTGNLSGELKPLLESVADDELKSVLGEAEQIAEALQAVKTFIPEPSAEVNSEHVLNEKSPKNDVNFPLAAVSSFADPVLVGALTDYMAK